VTDLGDDAALLRRHVGGDPDAFAELVRRHRDRLWAVALRTLGNPEDAADAVQDGLINAFRRAASYRGDAAVSTWLHRIVVNACLDRVRQAASRPAVTWADEFDPPSSSPDPGDHAATHLDVQAALAALPADQRAALVLVDMEGVPVAEVAELLGCPVGTVKSRCARGRARLLPLLAEGNPASVRDVPSTPAHTQTRRVGGEP
jgi:RNA polymerase sigma-70 factor, ECF subfamily